MLNAPSVVILHAVPKLSCNAKIVKIKATPASSNPKTFDINPNDATTVPPGTPGAPTAKIPKSKTKVTIVPTSGI